MNPTDILTLQIVFHLTGDYITQSHWMAENKGKNWRAALAHATVYTLPFYLIADGNARAIIVLTHFLIDRYRLAVYLVYLKNFLFDPRYWRLHIHAFREGYRSEILDMPRDLEKYQQAFAWENCKSTGYPKEVPFGLAIWLLIIADNICHLCINYLAIRFL